MKDSLAQRLRRARSEKGLSQSTLAAKLDVTTRTIQRWENGEQVPDSNYLVRIAKAVGVASHWLLTGDGDPHGKPSAEGKIIPFPSDRYKRVKLVSLPLLSSVPGGAPSLTFHPDYVEKYITVDNVTDSTAFALEVKGNSMASRIENSDVVIVSPRMEVRNGDICVVRVGDEDTLKRIRMDGQFLHLIPLNPDYEPMVVKKKDVVFMWRVVKVIKNV